MVEDKTVVSKPEKVEKVSQFWPHTRRRAITFTILIQIIVVLLAALALIVVGVAPGPTEFIFILTALFASAIGMNLLLLTIIMAPIRDISAALTHVSGEPNDLVAPNTTSPARRYDGLSPVLQLIYSLSSTQDETGESQSTDTKDTHALIGRALEQITAGIIALDENGEVLYASKHAPVSLDTDGKKRVDLIFEGEVDYNFWLDSVKETKVRDQKTWLRVGNKVIGDPDRRIFDVSVHYEKGSSTPVVLMAFDQTDQYKPEDDQLDFISFAAHELRGPVTVIRGYLDVFREELEQPTIDIAERNALLSRLIVSANRLSSYITNILNASRYDRQHLRLSLREYSLFQLYSLIADDMNLRATTQNRLLSVEISPDLPTIAADPSSLSEVFSNLIDNALKYSNEGGSVTVSARVDGDFVWVDVTDRGIGMPPNVISNLFHKFYRSHRSRETVAGTGIGLYISKAIVQSHGGTVEVKSEEGKGSTFSFSVPVYATVADKLLTTNHTNQAVVSAGSQGWIKNHAKYRG